MIADSPVVAVLTEFRGVEDCVVRLPNGDSVAAVFDKDALRQAHGPIYGIKLGGAVRVTFDGPSARFRIVWIEQVK